MKVFETREDLLKSLDSNLIICEIGVFKGEFSKFILDNLSPKELHLIDIFEGTVGSGDKDGNNVVFVNLNEELVRITTEFKPFENVKIHKGFSGQILNQFDDEYFDLIYIDGDHSYFGVKNDINLSYQKTKPNGFICGHDYVSPRFDGVVRAVNEFCTEKNLKIDYLSKDGCPTYCIKKLKN